MLSQKEKEQIIAKGITVEEVEKQIKRFVEGFPFANLVAPATTERGITRIGEDELEMLIKEFDSLVPQVHAIKFVPASGAATRMFKDLFSYLSEAKKSGQEPLDKYPSVKECIERLKDFAFYSSLEKVLEKSGRQIDQLTPSEIISFILEEDGLGYGTLPKGLLEFHRYEDHARTPLEEHLVEAANYSKRVDGSAHLHFTVSPEHMDKFKQKVAEVKPKLEKDLQVRFEIAYSIQKPETDTIAVNMDDSPFLEEDGTLLFRPAGHGALLSNLNDLDADLVYIKNIDNVIPDKLKESTYAYKKALGALLIKLKEEIFFYLERMAEGWAAEAAIPELERFYTQKMCFSFPESYNSLDSKAKLNYLHSLLNRPIRVCGMVKNSGETGGGPFLMQSKEGETSLQIVETAQIDRKKPSQEAILQKATHFNPNDLACWLKDVHGKKFNLFKYRDEDTGFISAKSKDGRDLKAQELPGLWNGSMSGWNTLFIEVPISTFNPVKTINDLLRAAHQA